MTFCIRPVEAKTVLTRYDKINGKRADPDQTDPFGLTNLLQFDLFCHSMSQHVTATQFRRKNPLFHLDFQGLGEAGISFTEQFHLSCIWIEKRHRDNAESWANI